MESKYVYIVISKSDTLPGKLIKLRTKLNFGHRYEKDTYTHLSLSLDNKLDNMKSFARKSETNIFNSGMINESIYDGFFKKGIIKDIIVIKYPVSSYKYNKVKREINKYWKNKDYYKYNFLALLSILVYGKTVKDKKNRRFYCSEWVTKVLSDADVIKKDCLKLMRPGLYYHIMKDYVIYEGSVNGYIEKYSLIK